MVEPKGKVRSIVFPGPSNYESIKKGDEGETHWVPYLAQSICVQGNEVAYDPNSMTETNVESLQRILDYKKYQHLLDENVVVIG